MRPARTVAAAGMALVAVLGATAACADDAARRPAPVADATTEAPTTTGADTTTTIAAPTGPVAITLRTVATLDAPTAMVPRAGTDDLYVAEREGVVRRVRRDGDAFAVDRAPVLDLRDRVADLTSERGLLGLAFDPTGEHLFVSHTDGGDDGASVIARYTMDGDAADPGSRIEILRIAQPFPNHNGGDVAFGPDGNLWAGYGDGGGQGDPFANAQDPSSLLGKMLRIDVSGATADAPYAIPADNPFVGRSGAAEVWAYGLRNPWRFSFDRATGDLWIADVGGSEWEEINRLPAADGRGRGANLGWNVREGLHPTGEDAPDGVAFVDPVFEYGHDRGASITGGFVYRGEAVPALRGVYLFSDFAAAELRGIVVGPDGADEVTLDVGGERLSQVVSFAQDSGGELYVLQLTGGVVRIDAG